MANEMNLISNDKRTPNERRENAKKAGIASGKARKKKKTMREQAELLLSLKLNDEELKEKMILLGIPESDMTNQMAMIISMFNMVLKGKKGSVSAFNALQATIGEKPIEKVEINTNTDESVKKMNDYFKEKKKKTTNE